MFDQYFLIELRMRLTVLGEIVRDWAHQFHEIIATRGVRGILVADSGPIVVRERCVTQLRQKETRGYQPAPSRSEFLRGQRVFISKGSFIDTFAEYQFSCEKFDYVELGGFARIIRLPRGIIAAA